MQFRSFLQISANDPLDISVDGDSIVIRKAAPGCVFCGESPENLISLNGRTVCPSCLEALKSAEKNI